MKKRNPLWENVRAEIEWWKKSAFPEYTLPLRTEIIQMQKELQFNRDEARRTNRRFTVAIVIQGIAIILLSIAILLK